MNDVKRYVQKRNRDHELVLSEVDETDFIKFAQYVLASDYDALESELASARKDAERYRWLRHNNSDAVLCYDAPGADDQGWLPIDGNQLDAAIDAAIAREQGSEHAKD